MNYLTILRSRLDPDRLLVLALVDRDGVRVVERHEIPNDPAAVEALIARLRGPAQPVDLVGCRRCACCGRPLVGYDSPDLID